MSSVPVRPIEAPPLVRLRCETCDVAWTGASHSECWVCGQVGRGLRTVVRYNDRDLVQLDFDY